MSFLHLVFFIISPGGGGVGRSHHVYFDSRSFTMRLLDVDGGSGSLSSSSCFSFCFARTGILHSFLFDDNFLYGNGRCGGNVPVRSRDLSVDPFFWFLIWSKIVKLPSRLPGPDIDWETTARPHLDLSSARLADWVLNLISLLTLPSPAIMVFVMWTVPPSPICSCSR